MRYGQGVESILNSPRYDIAGHNLYREKKKQKAQIAKLNTHGFNFCLLTRGRIEVVEANTAICISHDHNALSLY